jgi:hypothetical protein
MTPGEFVRTLKELGSNYPATPDCGVRTHPIYSVGYGPINFSAAPSIGKRVVSGIRAGFKSFGWNSPIVRLLRWVNSKLLLRLYCAFRADHLWSIQGEANEKKIGHSFRCCICGAYTGMVYVHWPTQPDSVKLFIERGECRTSPDGSISPR